MSNKRFLFLSPYTIWPIVFGLLCTGLLMFVAWRETLTLEKERFLSDTEEIKTQIFRGLNAADEMATSLATLVYSSTYVDRDQFRIFSEEIIRRHPFIEATGYMPLVTHEERTVFETSMREKGFPTFTITERKNEFYQKSIARKHYFPLIFLEPFEPSSAVMLGFDALSDINFNKAIFVAIRSAETTPVASSTSGEFVTGYWLFKATFSGKTVPGTHIERRNTVNGLIALRVDHDKLINATTVKDNLEINTIISADTGMPAANLINQFNLSKTENNTLLTTLQNKYYINCFGQNVKVIFKRHLILSNINLHILITSFLFGLISTLLFFVIGRNMFIRNNALKNRNIEVERLVNLKTEELLEINEKLCQEIEERNRTEKNLAASESRFRELFYNMKNAVVLYEIDSDGQFVIIDFNKAAEKIEDIGRNEVIGKRLIDIFPGVQKFGFLEILERVFHTGKPEYFPTKLYHDNRIQGWRDNFIFKLSTDEVVAVYEDMTEKHRTEEQLRQAQRMKSIGTLAGGIAHDFNNILSAILGYSELTDMVISEDSPGKEHIEQVIQASHRAKDLVRQILTFSRKTEQKRTLLNIRLLVKEVLKLLRASIPSTIEIKENIDQNCGNILADATQIHQVIVNLCTNAAQSIGQKNGILEVSLQRVFIDEQSFPEQPHKKTGPYILLSFQDTGQGIHPDNIDRIFEPYFTTKEVGKGSGMGLAVVHGIVTSHDGFIDVQSTPGEGTLFNVFFPEIEEVLLEALGDDESLPRGNEHILVVDDELQITSFLTSALNSLGYNVTTKTSSIEALNEFSSHPDSFDLLVTDQTMPQMTGTDLAKAILAKRPDFPIVLCTGYRTTISEEEGKRIGIKEFAYKPLDMKELSNIVRSTLDEHSRTK